VRCELVLDRLPDHTLGSLSEEDAAAVRSHLRGCAACRSDAEGLDQGLSMFASAAHEVEPPPELQERVLSVLAEEWAESPAVLRPSRRPAGAWLAVAACLALLGGALVWGTSAHRTVDRQAAILATLQGDAKAYRNFLHTLGGKAVRVATLSSRAGSAVTGTAVLYDSDVGQSWVLVLARRPVGSGKAFVTIGSPDGGKPLKLFAIQFDERGDGSTWLVTSADISRFDHVQLWGPDGTLLADGTAAPDHS
jgi:anti-sigma factor RsiW